MKFQTSDLSGMMLDFACAQFDDFCEGIAWEFRGNHYAGLYSDSDHPDETPRVVAVICDHSEFPRMVEHCRYKYHLPHQAIYSPSTNWARGGPIIEHEKIRLDGCDNQWRMPSWKWTAWPKSGNGYNNDSPLIAAMRAFVASKAGDTIELAGAV